MSFLTVPQAVTLLDDRDPPPKIKKAFLKGLYAAQKDLSAWQCVPRWPAESQVLPETVKHIRSVPGEPEVFYEPTGTASEILKCQSVFLYNLGRLNDFIGQKCLNLKLRSVFVPTKS